MDDKKMSPRKLTRNITYPSYQLWSTVENKRTPQETAMVIAILTSLSWLRKKFSEMQMPEKLIAPEPDNYKGVTLNDFNQFHIDCGYTLDIVSLPDEKVWSLRLIEPDYGFNYVEEQTEYPPVPGRMIETYIAFRIVGGDVECGFRVVIAEPEGCAVPCGVFRPVVVKELARNPLVGLKQGIKIQDSAFELIKKQDISKLFSAYSNNSCTAPFVVFAQQLDKSASTEQAAKIEQIVKEIPAVSSPLRSSFSTALKVPFEAKKIVEPYLPYDIESISRYRMGFAFFFVLSYELVDAFNEAFGTKIRSGDIAVIEQKCIGGKTKIISFSAKEKARNETIKKLSVSVRQYPVNKTYDFGNVIFHNDAMELHYRMALRNINSLNDFQSRCEICKLASESEKKQKTDELNALNNRNIINYEKKIIRCEKDLSDKDEALAQLTKEAEISQAKLNNEIEELKGDAEFFKSLSGRPTDPKAIPTWVEVRFGGRLIFHEKAVKLISEVRQNEVDMAVLCDAIDFLAAEYRNKLLGEISEEKMKNLCSRRYNRPFWVKPIGSRAIEFSPTEYKVRYSFDSSSKTVDAPLDLHLGVGNDSESLLRIYFFFDKEKKLVVVGSLPKHLSTITGF